MSDPTHPHGDQPTDPTAHNPQQTGPAQPAADPTSSHRTPDAQHPTIHAPQSPYATPGPHHTQPHDPGAPHRDEVWTPAPEAARKANPTPVIAALVVGALVGGVSGAGVAVWAVTSSQSQTTTGSSAAPVTVTVNDPDDATLVTAIAASAGPSVVTINVEGRSAAGSGSGVFISDDGYIITNTHVVTLDGASANVNVNVQTWDGRLLAADIIGTDPLTDLAVIKVDGTGYPAIEWGDSANLNVGDITVAIGAPLGLSNTVTNGIVSALNRSITIASSAAPDADAPEEEPQNPFDFWRFENEDDDPGTSAQAYIYLPVIQTDAAINPGNSGGALLDGNGNLIGVNVAIAGTGNGASAGNIGVGFAIPSNLAKRIATELIANGTAGHALLGVSIIDTTLDENITNNTFVGASVREVVPGGPGDEAGLRVGDIITRFNDIPITGSIDLTAQVRATAPDTDATVVYVRDGAANTTTVRLGSLE